MSPITLRQLLQYSDQSSDVRDRIQIVQEYEDWECADELHADSDLLEPFMNYNIDCLGIERSFYDDSPIIRVSIMKGE